MTSDHRVLIDDSGKLAQIVDGLHDVVAALGDRRFAIVGGIAVMFNFASLLGPARHLRCITCSTLYRAD